jgi:DNA-binding transcriptional LysR family regulator
LNTTEEHSADPDAYFALTGLFDFDFFDSEHLRSSEFMNANTAVHWLLIRNPRGIELTAAGKPFLDHARLALIQVDAAKEAARRAAKPRKPTFAIGFLTGQEIDWPPEVMRVLRDELPEIDVTLSSQSLSRDLGDALMRGKLDVAFLRAEMKAANLIYKVATKEPLVVILPSDHRLASREVIVRRKSRARDSSACLLLLCNGQLSTTT